jgi:hypothetical protein
MRLLALILFAASAAWASPPVYQLEDLEGQRVDVVSETGPLALRLTGILRFHREIGRPGDNIAYWCLESKANPCQVRFEEEHVLQINHRLRRLRRNTVYLKSAAFIYD